MGMGEWLADNGDTAVMTAAATPGTPEHTFVAAFTAPTVLTRRSHMQRLMQRLGANRAARRRGRRLFAKLWRITRTEQMALTLLHAGALQSMINRLHAVDPNRPSDRGVPNTTPPDTTYMTVLDVLAMLLADDDEPAETRR